MKAFAKILMLVLALSLPASATVTATNSYQGYACNGTNGPYTITFPYLSSSDLTVVVTSYLGVAATLAPTTDYTISATSTKTTATLSLVNGAVTCPLTSLIKISRAVALTQPTSFLTQGTFSPATHETAFDRLEMQVQQLNSGFVASTSGLTLDAAQITSGVLTEARGGTGTGPLTCGAGQALTSNGTAYSCTASVGATPATCGANQVLTYNGTTYSCVAKVDLQASFSGTTQTGHIHLSGQVGADNLSGGGGVLLGQPPGSFSRGGLYIATDNGNLATLGVNGGFGFQGTGANSAAFGMVYGASFPTWKYPTLFTTDTVTFQGGSTSTSPPNYSFETPAVGILNAASGNDVLILRNANGGTTKYFIRMEDSTQTIVSSINYNGAALFGATTTGALSIGSGTNIASSYRGTTSWTPGSVGAGSCVSTTIAITATAGTECAFGPPSVPANGLAYHCAITANTCNLTACNPSAGALTGAAGTWSCRAFNP